MFFNSGYGGTSQAIGAGAKANLKAGLKNENASQEAQGWKLANWLKQHTNAAGSGVTGGHYDHVSMQNPCGD
ncbi:hypothetical protein AB0E59_30310 [Lentzea sp. NPDC034063]|uniref:hypothetical protein n=1 Tax=unclassified Lentzea TaxID=2643253 RepID=UPI0033D84E8A